MNRNLNQMKEKIKVENMWTVHYFDWKSENLAGS